MGIFDKRIAYKPFEYPKAMEFIDALQGAFWTHCVHGEDRVPTTEGLLTVEELYEKNKPFMLFDGEVVKSSNTPMKKLGRGMLYEISTKEGFTHTVTANHKVMTDTGWVELRNLKEGDLIDFQKKEGVFGGNEDKALAYLLGLFQGDGCVTKKGDVILALYQPKYKSIPLAQECLYEVFKKYNPTKRVPKFNKEHNNNRRITTKMFCDKGFEKGVLPDWLWSSNKETISMFLKGLFETDACCIQDRKHQGLRLTSIDRKFLKDVQLLLLNMGIFSRLVKVQDEGFRNLPDGKGGHKEYFTKTAYALEITRNKDFQKLEEIVNLFEYRGRIVRKTINENKARFSKFLTISSIKEIGEDDFYCITLGENPTWVCNGFITHNSEFNFTQDIQDFKVNMTTQEQEITRKCLLAISTIEVNVKTFWAKLYDHIPKPEINALGVQLSFNELVHERSYSQILEILGLNEDFERILEVPEIKGRIDYLQKYMKGKDSENEKRAYILTVALFSAFVENVSLFSQFYIMKSLNKHKAYFKGVDNVLSASMIEEDLHHKVGVWLIDLIRNEYPEWFDDDFKNQLKKACKKAYEAELKIVNWIMGYNDLPYLKTKTIEEFLKHRFNQSLEAIGIDPLFEVDTTEIQNFKWFELELKIDRHADFFHKRPTTYSRDTNPISENDLF